MEERRREAGLRWGFERDTNEKASEALERDED